MGDGATSVRGVELRLGAELMPFGPIPEAEGGVEVAATFGEYPAEYAAIRRYVGVMHLPQRGVLRLTGKDRAAFLNGLVTQDVKAMAASPGSTRRSFLLNEKGRIVADLVVHHGDADTWLEMDRFEVGEVAGLLEKRLFAEDVSITDLTGERAALAVFGPGSAPLLEALREGGTPAAEVAPETHHVLGLGGVGVTVYRWDDAGSAGFRLLVPAAGAAGLYERLLSASGYEPGVEPSAEAAAKRRGSLRGRPVGWLAYNTARVEAGSPLFHVDFGTDSLPAETGLLEATTSFTKGCYIGQEIVARMRSLGHPRRVLVGLRFAGDALPLAGAQVLDAGDRATVVGGVTSSTLSPVLGNVAVALAVVKWGRHEAGTKLVVPAEGSLVEGVVGPLRSLD